MDDNLFDAFKEYASVFVKEKIIDETLGFLFNNKVMSLALKLSGLKDTLKSELNPTLDTITSLDSRQMYSIWDEFNQVLNGDTIMAYDYVSQKYDPSLVDRTLNDVVDDVFGSIPLLGEINLGIPESGDVMHTAVFKTRDSNGYIKIIEMNFTYGIFKDPAGVERAGPKFVEFTVVKSDWPNDLFFTSGSRIETHRRSPWL